MFHCPQFIHFHSGESETLCKKCGHWTGVVPPGRTFFFLMKIHGFQGIREEVQTFFFLRKIHGVHAWFSGFTRGGPNFVILAQNTWYIVYMVYHIPWYTIYLRRSKDVKYAVACPTMVVCNICYIP